ncbi:MAG: magnesium chelatase family protein [Parcubacteria group bacterium Gr01-1014_30]|nr:MAG: magnesium chelatase family protein [Parcubacteria group bacterium Gr01-1014_30]
MLAKVFSAAIVGLDAQLIEVEVETSYGLRHFAIVGLPDKAVEEAKERVASAVKSSGFQSPNQQPVRILVSLAPADLKKEGSLYDLPIALGYLLAAKKVKFEHSNRIFLGELALDGRLRPIKGVVSFAIAAKEKGISEIILPKENAQEAALIKGVKVVGVENLKEVIDYLEGSKEISSLHLDPELWRSQREYSMDLCYVKGQESSKRALEIAASGDHNLLMTGPPGAGKTIMAKSLPSILPPLEFEEALEVTKIYSVAGLLPKNRPLISARPFRSPHHTSSEAALIGGGTPPKPGEITLSHRGVLFLDEFPEFHRDVLESLRQPLEDRQITVMRARHSTTFPCSFQLVASANPCPCGNLGDEEKNCGCTTSQVRMYTRKMSGPLMDRVDLFINVPKLKYEKLAADQEKCSCEETRERVKSAREIQKARFNKTATNSEMTLPQIKKHCQVNSSSSELLKKYVDSGKLSARGYHRVLKVARTIADLDNSSSVKYSHVSEALMYRVRAD